MKNGGKVRVIALAIAFTFSIFHFPFAIASASAAPTTQQAATQPAATTRQSLADLGSSDARKREDARMALMGLSREDLPAVRDLVKQNLPLAPAQEAALQEIVTHVYLAGSDANIDQTGGFLGLHDSYENRLIPPGDDAQGVLVQTRVPGFCGYRFLQDGDLIQSVVAPVAMPLSNFDQLRAIVGMMRPGNTIMVEVLRHGEKRRVSIPLDPRPLELMQMGGIGAFDNYVERRNALADEYWQKTFAPLFQKSVL